jgi:F-type H+-transporting ATPase subunit a
MDLSPDQMVIWQWKFIKLNATILSTWIVMAFLTLGSWLITRRLTASAQLSRAQNLLEVLVEGLTSQIQEISQQEAGKYLYFIGTLFIFIATSNFLSIIPGYQPPTGSLSTTTALALCVFVAVPIYGIAQQGLGGYLGHYIQPTIFMAPFHIISEISRTLALAVRLFGNVMSGTVIVGLLLAIVPLFFPIVFKLLELLIGMIQAFIFAVLATVYIASATQAHAEQKRLGESGEEIDQPQQNNL